MTPLPPRLTLAARLNLAALLLKLGQSTRKMKLTAIEPKPAQP